MHTCVCSPTHTFPPTHHHPTQPRPRARTLTIDSHISARSCCIGVRSMRMEMMSWMIPCQEGSVRGAGNEDGGEVSAGGGTQGRSVLLATWVTAGGEGLWAAVLASS